MTTVHNVSGSPSAITLCHPVLSAIYSLVGNLYQRKGGEKNEIVASRK